MINKKVWPDVLPRKGNHGFEKVESVSPWFVIYRINDDTFGILEPRHREEPMTYLIMGDKSAVLFDTGMGIANIRSEVENLTNLPVVVVNSHSDYDHLGGNHLFEDVWAFNDDWEIKRIQRGYDIARCERYMNPKDYFEFPKQFDPLTYQILPSRVTRRLKHLETIDLGNRILTIHNTPGHTPGSICLTDERDGLFFTGDTFYQGLMEVADIPVYCRSLEYMITLLDRMAHLCPAHNEVYAPKEMLHELLKDFKRIIKGEVPFKNQGETRTYYFDRYSLKMPHSVAR